MKWLHSEITEESVYEITEELIQGFVEWLNVGGQATVDEFKKLEKTEQSDILDYLGQFSLYEELAVNGKNYVLVHAGLDNFESNKSLREY